MSYCSIVEAWGEPFETPDSSSVQKPKQPTSDPPRRKKRRSKHRNRDPRQRQQSSRSTSNTDQSQVWGKQHWEAPDQIQDLPINPNAYSRQFARDLPSGQLDNALHVSLAGAPFQPDDSASSNKRVTEADIELDFSDAEDIVAEEEYLPPAAEFSKPNTTYAPTHASTRPPNTPPQSQQHTPSSRPISTTFTPSTSVPCTTTSPSATPAPIIHEELDWMRNHLSHLTDRIEALNVKLDDTSSHGPVSVTPPATMADSVLYVVTGAFAVVLIDVLFRAGRRSRE